jgi:hypothetical protein
MLVWRGHSCPRPLILQLLSQSQLRLQLQLPLPLLLQLLVLSVLPAPTAAFHSPHAYADKNVRATQNLFPLLWWPGTLPRAFDVPRRESLHSGLRPNASERSPVPIPSQSRVVLLKGNCEPH